MIKIEDINKKKKLKNEIVIFCIFFFLLLVLTGGLSVYTYQYEASPMLLGITYGLAATLLVSFLALSIGVRFKSIYSKEIEEIVRANANRRTTRQELITATINLFNKSIPQNNKVVVYLLSL